MLWLEQVYFTINEYLLKMTGSADRLADRLVDIIFAEPLDCYIEVKYNRDNELGSIRFIKRKENIEDIKTLQTTVELDEYFKGERESFSCNYDISGLSVFSRKVLNETKKIRYGRTITYSGLARNSGTRSARAVGRALANNPIPIIIPCHRIIAKNGIGGYSGGLEIKTRLLEFERKHARTFNVL
ncbi:MAG: methylated-DNA--[protein]-cysteine S-methyltransferase [Candidatus Methanoperedens sp.]|nr:methylated-DNA--[protein]-cysteine S-methyltransferase [Candidatus Methanoperedens sp.]